VPVREPAARPIRPARLVTRYLLLAVGRIALGLGVVGIVVPVLPTVPFLLPAAACFTRGSGRPHHWPVTHPVFGHHLADSVAGRGLRPWVKVAVLLPWASVLLSVGPFVPLLWADVVMVAVALAVSARGLSLPTCLLGPPFGGSRRDT
jgi:uncharacterized membrane protein YbaN (DUF454 family)